MTRWCRDRSEALTLTEGEIVRKAQEEKDTTARGRKRRKSDKGGGVRPIRLSCSPGEQPILMN